MKSSNVIANSAYLMTHDQEKLANICWPTCVGQLFLACYLHDTRAGKVGQQMDNMADFDDEDALFAFLFLRHMSKDLDNLTQWMDIWLLRLNRKCKAVSYGRIPEICINYNISGEIIEKMKLLKI